MGYYATTGGTIELKQPIAKELILKRAVDTFFDLDPHFYDETEDSITLDFCGHQKYDQDMVFDFLTDIEPLTIAGEIEYTGEEGDLWKHHFDPEKKLWFEQEGHVEYEVIGKSIASLRD